MIFCYYYYYCYIINWFNQNSEIEIISSTNNSRSNSRSNSLKQNGKLINADNVNKIEEVNKETEQLKENIVPAAGEIPLKPLKRADSKRERRLAFKGN